ncbi:hypothetical protein FT663_05250 [Candidozyma haemuli var. vulneris]|uniref:Rhodanese domain-containing protein n=1 Tax=Candidozyma haemuli TaxID=45357 RepID=A0A2V1ATK9_9ASCO|nr:hypothetical protein CXQ85_000488 [[Candida] haemuloni]KAF3985555.1 hypothetical protein FT663_05250 [[Candida] haemuloni var. vulneris]KAF3989441.1 hypothetical protein FT662_02807 [[Candida] haemuloni var. vulneris]PVH21507.1 hypothetical protein CXQ85_000488 [[Candida] haemuloni]
MAHRILARDAASVARNYAASRSISGVASAAAAALARAPRTQTRSVVGAGLGATWARQYRGGFRFYSVLSSQPAKVFKYDDMKKIVAEANPSTVILDVREPVEFQEGHIPGAHNVPFKSSPGALDLSEEDFEDAFGFQKPAKDSELVFYCLGGVRSTAAEELAHSFGYNKRANYVGSWEDWVAHENHQTK